MTDPSSRLLHSLPTASALPRWLPRVVEVVLLLVLALLLGRLALDAFRPGFPLLPTVPVHAGPTTIPTTDLFFRRPGPGPAGAGSVEGLVLHGIRGGASASAILAGSDGMQRAWPIGSEPAPGVVLADIGHDHVVLRRSSGTTRLELTRRQSAGARPTVAAAARPAAPVRATAAATSAPAPSGYRLGAEAERLPLRLAGLKPGDEILSINGQAVGDDPAALRERLSGQTRFELRYRRAGRMHTATVGLP